MQKATGDSSSFMNGHFPPIMKWIKFYLLIFLCLFNSLCVCARVCHSSCTLWGQRPSCGGWLSPSTKWVLGIKLRLRGLAVPTEPSFCPLCLFLKGIIESCHSCGNLGLFICCSSREDLPYFSEHNALGHRRWEPWRWPSALTHFWEPYLWCGC